MGIGVFGCIKVAHLAIMQTSFILTIVASMSVFGMGYSTSDETRPQMYEELVGGTDSKETSSAAMGACPQTSYLFPNIEQTTNYIRVTTPIPDLDEFTVCGLFKRFTNGYDFWVSYATMPGTSNNHNEYGIADSSDYIEISMNGYYLSEALKLTANIEYHICVTNFASDGRSNVYINGDMAVVVTTRSGTIDGAGSFIIGQDQDKIGGGFQSHQSFQGTLRNFMLWRRALNQEEIQEMYQNLCVCPQDYLFTLERENIEIFGGATAVWPDAECQSFFHKK